MKTWVVLALVASLTITYALPVPEDDLKADSSEQPSGVANTLSQSTKALVDTKTQLLKGLTGASAGLQADASSNTESVQRNERANTGGYSSGGYSSNSFGPNTVAETPNSFVNVFSQAAANTVNFGTQLLNSLVGVAANILQGTVSTLLSLLNAKGQVVGAVVQSAPPVLASVTRTAGDVLAAKARIFGAVTQAAVSFGSQLARTFGDTFNGILNRPGSDSGSGNNPLSQLSQLFSGLGGSRGLGGSSSGGYSASGLSSSGSGSTNLLGGVGNFAQTLINAKLNLLNGLLAPFTGGRPLLNFGNRGSSSSSSFSEPNFRISISSASTPSSNSASSSDSASTTRNSGPRYARFYALPEAMPKRDGDELTPQNLIATFKSGVFKGIVDQLNSDLQSRIARLASGVSDGLAQYDNSNSYVTKVLPREDQKQQQETADLFAKILPFAFRGGDV